MLANGVNTMQGSNATLVHECFEKCKVRHYFADWSTYTIAPPWELKSVAEPPTPYVGLTARQCMPTADEEAGEAIAMAGESVAMAGDSMPMPMPMPMPMLFSAVGKVGNSIPEKDYLEHCGNVRFDLEARTSTGFVLEDPQEAGFQFDAKTGRVLIAPKGMSKDDEPREYDLRLLAYDYAETEFVVRDWHATILPRPAFVADKESRQNKTMDVKYFVPDQDPTVTSKLPISTDTDPASVHIAGPLIAGYDAAAATTCNTAIDSCAYVLKVEPPTPAWFINSDTGEVFGKFLDDDNGTTFTFSVYASDAFDPGYTDGLVEKFAITALYRDTHTATNGPNREGCHNGTAIDDTDLFDNIFTCTCNDGFVYANCDFDQKSAAAKQQSAAAKQLGGTLGGIIVVIALLLCAVQYRKYQISMQATDFKLELEKFKEEGIIDPDMMGGGSGAEPLVPKELKRSGIEITEKIGEGQFGEVALGSIDMAKAAGIQGIPPYAVAIKTVHDSTNEGAIELIREDAVMAQVPANKYLVSIIGVVTRGLPMMLVAQFCEHGSLLDVLRKYADGYGPLLKRPKSVEWIGFEIASGMQHLASKHFIHRDLAGMYNLYYITIPSLGLAHTKLVYPSPNPESLRLASPTQALRAPIIYLTHISYSPSSFSPLSWIWQLGTSLSTKA